MVFSITNIPIDTNPVTIKGAPATPTVPLRVLLPQFFRGREQRFPHGSDWLIAADLNVSGVNDSNSFQAPGTAIYLRSHLMQKDK